MLDARPAPDALPRPPLPRTRHRPARIAGPSVRRRCPVFGSPDPAAGPGGRHAARRRDPPGRHDGGLRRDRRRGRMGLEGRLRGRRGRLRAVPSTLRAGHAPHLRRRGGRAAPHAGHAGGPRGAGALAHQTVGGAGPAPAVLDPAAARLRRVARCRDPAGRRRAGAQRRHRHAGGHGGMRARGERRRQSPPQRNRANPRPASDPVVPAGGRDGIQRRVYRRPSARRPADRGADEPRPSRRRPASTAAGTTPTCAMSAPPHRCCRRAGAW